MKPKFLVDENLSPQLSKILKEAGYDSFHINESKGDRLRILDSEISAFATEQKLVVITSDHDFVRSYFRRGIPSKLVFFHGVHSNHGQTNILRENLSELVEMIKTNSLLEISEKGVRVP